MDFAAWLDTHGPTLRAADQPAIELLRRVREENMAADGWLSYDLAVAIDAVLKAAGGG